MVIGPAQLSRHHEQLRLRAESRHTFTRIVPDVFASKLCYDARKGVRFRPLITLINVIDVDCVHLVLHLSGKLDRREVECQIEALG